MKKLLQIVLISSLSLLCFSCYYDEIIEKPIVESITDPDNPSYVEIKFQDDIQSLFNKDNCMECHNSNRDPDLRDGNSYNALFPEFVTKGNAAVSSLYTFLDDGHRNLNDEELELIKTWIDQGAENN